MAAVDTSPWVVLAPVYEMGGELPPDASADGATNAAIAAASPNTVAARLMVWDVPFISCSFPARPPSAVGSCDPAAGRQRSGEDAAVRLAGHKVRIDKNSGKLRDLSQQEARELVSTLTAMTTQTERAAARTPGGGTLVEMNGFDHVLVGRPNENGTTDVLCASSMEEAVSFLSQQPTSSGKE